MWAVRRGTCCRSERLLVSSNRANAGRVTARSGPIYIPHGGRPLFAGNVPWWRRNVCRCACACCEASCACACACRGVARAVWAGPQAGATTCTHENTGESWCVHARARGMLASDVWASDSGSRLGMWRRLTMLICGACAHREVLIKGGGDGVVRALIYSHSTRDLVHQIRLGVQLQRASSTKNGARSAPRVASPRLKSTDTK